MSLIPAVLLKVLVLICLIVAIPACDNAALQHLNQGDQYIKQGLIEQAIVEYDKAINVDPVLSSSHIAKLDEKYRLLLASGYQEQALAAMTKGESGTARDAFTRAIELNPDLAEAYCYRAINDLESGAPYWGGATWDEVFADCNRAIELKPGYAKAYDARGFANYKVGNSDQCIADYSKSIELD
ncbi:MAG: hypothetical protein MUO97_08315, partial [Dehalococcoidia bacterium]|nr:hypothetical protein [Dehalococcoidia bacterium]